MEIEKNCACKGIRTCLLCEKEDKPSRSWEENKVVEQYLYCPYCNLCWPVGSDDGAKPLYLGRMTVIPDFIAEEEEAEMIAAIDGIQWMPSQSGRKKQDFGPKVNFKKMKAKIGEFKGFPRFTENLARRLKQHKDLSDFRPVELCHLDYEPERGSAIEPHIDDSWIWGERLVTINLASPTILTFTPAKREADCDCSNKVLSLKTINQKEHCKIPAGNDDTNKDGNGPEETDRSSCLPNSGGPLYLTCDCCNIKALSSIKSSPTKEHCKVPAGNDPNGNSNKDGDGSLGYSPIETDDSSCHLNSEDITCDCCNIKALSSTKSSTKKYCNRKVTADSLLDAEAGYLKTSFTSNSKDMCAICDCHTRCTNAVSFNDRAIKENVYCDYKVPSPEEANTIQGVFKTDHNSKGIKTQNKATLKDLSHWEVPTDYPIRNGRLLCNHKEFLDNHLNRPELFNPIADMCTDFRIGQKSKNVEVLVPLPPRSLVVVAGCCRHNWFHEIRRRDIVSRRLAMTFRELSWNFMAGGPDQDLGAELLELGRTFFD